MANFRFRLETLLKVREAERQQRRLELGQAFDADRLLQQQFDALAAELTVARQESRTNSAPGEVNVDKLLELQRYALHVLAQTKAIRLQQSTVREEIERRRKLLVEADRQVKTLEKLREKQLAVFRTAQLHIEQKVLDEVGARIARSNVQVRRNNDQSEKKR